MANNRKTTRGRNNTTQVIFSEPQRIFKEKYLTPKGKLLLANKAISKEDAWSKYGKNRYITNPNAIAIRTVIHPAIK